jgi:ABC-type multidrug transport system fused ATPase/permease subunit
MSQGDVERAAKAANIYDVVLSLPEGFDTNIGDRGITLSGGQRQRIVLARALAANPKVLVLDEATSALDSDSERLIQEAIHGLHGKVAVVVIAHRLSTVEHADEIIVLDKGTVVERGSPAALLQNPASYFAKHYSA